MYFSANSPGGDYLLRRHQLFTRLGKPTGFQHLLSQIIVVVIGDNCVLLLLFSYRLVAGNDFYYGDTNPSQDWENQQVFSNSSLKRSLFLLMLLLLLLLFIITTMVAPTINISGKATGFQHLVSQEIIILVVIVSMMCFFALGGKLVLL